MRPTVPGPAPRRVVVLRHGETDHNAARIWQGHLDTRLSERGLQQADAVGPAIAALSPDRIVSSDLTRARLTAESVGRACGIPVELDPRFREIDVGAWQGLTAAEVADATGLSRRDLYEGALEQGAKAISGLRRDASADGRLGRRSDRAHVSSHP